MEQHILQLLRQEEGFVYRNNIEHSKKQYPLNQSKKQPKEDQSKAMTRSDREKLIGNFVKV